MTTPDNEEQAQDTTQDSATHWTLMRDVIGFQFKLAVDGIRDLLLSPISIGAALLGVIVSPSNPGKYFNQVLKVGYRSDRWINLFGATDHYEEGEISTDTYIRKAEEMIRKEYEKGGVVKSVKETTDGLIGKIRPQGKDDRE